MKLGNIGGGLGENLLAGVDYVTAPIHIGRGHKNLPDRLDVSGPGTGQTLNPAAGAPSGVDRRHSNLGKAVAGEGPAAGRAKAIFAR